MTSEQGLRERKKQRTRESIARAAHQLFVQRGYSETTLPEIAEAADVSTRTIFAYFPSKEDILFSAFTETTEQLAKELAERPAGTDALETVREFIMSGKGAGKSDLEDQLFHCITADETLRNHLRARIVQVEEVIAPALAEDLGLPVDDHRVQLVAASFTAAFTLLAERGGAKGEPFTPDELAAQVDPVINFLRAGIAALKESGSVARRPAGRAAGTRAVKPRDR